MRYSVGLPVDHVRSPDEFVTGDAIAEMAAAVEAAGLDAVFVTDHPAPDDRWLEGGGHHAQEPLVALAFAAAATRRVSCTPTCSSPRTGTRSSRRRAWPRSQPLGRPGDPRRRRRVPPARVRARWGSTSTPATTCSTRRVTLMRRVWTETGVAVETDRYFGPRRDPAPAAAARPDLDRRQQHRGDAARGGARRRLVAVPEPAGRGARGEDAGDHEPRRARGAPRRGARAYADGDRAHRAARRLLRAVPRRPTTTRAFADLGIDWLAVQFDGCTTRAEWLDRLAAFVARRV